MNTDQLIGYMIIFCSFFICAMILAKPIKKFFIFIFRGFVGIIAIFFINYLFSGFNLYVGLNIITFMMVGVLGIPGIVLLYLTSIVLQ